VDPLLKWLQWTEEHKPNVTKWRKRIGDWPSEQGQGCRIWMHIAACKQEEKDEETRERKEITKGLTEKRGGQGPGNTYFRYLDFFNDFATLQTVFVYYICYKFNIIMQNQSQVRVEERDSCSKIGTFVWKNTKHCNEAKIHRNHTQKILIICFSVRGCKKTILSSSDNELTRLVCNLSQKI